MNTVFPWDDDFEYSKIVPFKKRTEHLYYAVRDNYSDIPNDENDNYIDFCIISGSKNDLLSMGYDESQIFNNDTIAIIFGAIKHGYFDEILEKCHYYKVQIKKEDL